MYRAYQNFSNCVASNTMESFHAVEWFSCKCTITWNAFQVIPTFTNHPCYCNLPISKLVEACIFQVLTALDWVIPGFNLRDVVCTSMSTDGWVYIIVSASSLLAISRPPAATGSEIWIRFLSHCRRRASERASERALIGFLICCLCQTARERSLFH